MICGRCGRNFPSHQATHMMVGDRMGDSPRTVPLTICPDCAAGRWATLKFYVYFFVALAVGSLVIAMFGRAF
jgi:hypothetical protein